MIEHRSILRLNFLRIRKAKQEIFPDTSPTYIMGFAHGVVFHRDFENI